MKRFLLILLLAGSSWMTPAIAQNIIHPGVGIKEVKLGTSPEDIFWALGFEGIKLTRAGAPDVLKKQAANLDIDFDYIHNYQHIMAYPVSTVYFKADKAVMIVLSSYPEYNQVLCMGMKTREGLNFWDSQSEMKKIYGKDYEEKSGDFDFYYYKSLGLSITIDENEIRSMSIFNPR